MKLLDLFTGIGGFSLAFKRNCPNGEIVGFSEIDKYAIQIYENNFKGVRELGNIRNIEPESIPDFDLLTGGFPCQPFSVAGIRRGSEDSRGNLFFEILKILRVKKPSYLLLENVKGLLSIDNGRTYFEYKDELGELGYDSERITYNSKHFGVPQNRERLYIVGHLRGKARPEILSIGQAIQQANELYPSVNTITARYYDGRANGSYIVEGEQKIVQINNPVHSCNRLYSPEGIAPCLSTMQGGNRQPKIKIGDRARRLTPLECERLQGYPDNWTEGVSDSQRYKCLGNSITVNVAQEIIKKIKQVNALNKLVGANNAHTAIIKNN